MGKLITADENVFESSWCGVSTIDGSLRFGVKDISMVEAMNTFSNSKNTAIIKYSMNSTGEDAKEYSGYTDLIGIDKDSFGIITIALRKPQ